MAKKKVDERVVVKPGQAVEVKNLDDLPRAVFVPVHEMREVCRTVVILPGGEHVERALVQDSITKDVKVI